MNDWFRSWHGAPTDNKWLVVARKAGAAPGLVSAVVWALFDHASQNDPRGSVAGFDVETYAAFSGFEEVQIEAVIAALKDKGVIGPDGGLTAWGKRQPRREDGSAERARAWRERQHTGTERDRTPANAGERERPPERRGDPEGSDADASVAPSVATLPLTASDVIWQKFPRLFADLSGKSEPAVRTWIGKVLKGHAPESVLAAFEAAALARTGDPFGYATRTLTPGERRQPNRDPPPKVRSAQDAIRDLQDRMRDRHDAEPSPPMLPRLSG